MTLNSTGTDIDLAELHRRAIGEFDRRMRAVQPHQWTAPTPCTEWDVRALVDHVVVEQLWVPPLMEGKTIAEVGDGLGGDQLGDDPLDAWDRAATRAHAAFAAPGALRRTVHLSAGDTSGENYCVEMTFDATVHAWDLAKGIGADDRLDPELVDRVLELMREKFEAWRRAGAFASAVPVADDADVQTRLLALTGRER